MDESFALVQQKVLHYDFRVLLILRTCHKRHAFTVLAMFVCSELARILF